MAALPPAEPERELAPTSLSRRDARPGSDDIGDPFAGAALSGCYGRVVMRGSGIEAVTVGGHDQHSVSGRPENVCTTHIVPETLVVWAGERLGEAGELIEHATAQPPW